MRKSRGQSVVDFVVLALLAVSIIIFGIYKFGDGLANFFARNNVENKFNNARTVRLEKPQDLVSNVSVTFNGVPIQPPIEKVIKNKLAAGSYIQTSGSAGRLAQMTEVMEEYIDQIIPLVTAGAQGDAFKAALNAYKQVLDKGDGTGFMEIQDSLSTSQVLEQKLNMLKMAVSFSTTPYFADISTTLNNYLPTILASQPVRHDIIETFTTDLINLKNSVDYFIDPYLYVEYLNQEKKDTAAQDLQLVTALQTAAASMTPEDKQYVAGLIKVFYGSGYSSASPSAYNGERMCHTFSGTLNSATNSCAITGP